MFPEKKKKKVDYEALNSALMRIPRMDVAAARNLIDMGIREIYQLQGRAPEVLLEEARARTRQFPQTGFAFSAWRSIMQNVRNQNRQNCTPTNGAEP